MDIFDSIRAACAVRVNDHFFGMSHQLDTEEVTEAHPDERTVLTLDDEHYSCWMTQGELRRLIRDDHGVWRNANETLSIEFLASMASYSEKRPQLLSRPYTLDELKREVDQFGRIQATISVSLALLELGDYELLDDHVSNLITGFPAGLTDIAYSVAGGEQQNVFLIAGGVVDLEAVEKESSLLVTVA